MLSKCNFPNPDGEKVNCIHIPQIAEIVEDGSLRKVSEVCDSEKMRVLDLFNRVWGAGPSTAEQWYQLLCSNDYQKFISCCTFTINIRYQKGLRSLRDVEEKGNPNRHQTIGLRYFDELDERMQREECTEILEVVRNAALSIQSGWSTTQRVK